MTDSFYFILSVILLVPLIPAFIIYKFLPASDTDVSGPYQGLSLKLKGAFAGYFLLVIVGLVLQYAIMNNKQKKEIESLTAATAQKDTIIKELKSQLVTSLNPVIDWHIKGAVLPAGREGTRFFYDDGTTTSDPDGSFELIKRSIAKEGEARPPRWMCVYNSKTGFRVVSLNRDVQHPDIAAYNISFDDGRHEILVRKPIDINSMEKDSVVAVTNFIRSNPTLKAEVERTNPTLLLKGEKFNKERFINQTHRDLSEAVRRVNP